MQSQKDDAQNRLEQQRTAWNSRLGKVQKLYENTNKETLTQLSECKKRIADVEAEQAREISSSSEEAVAVEASLAVALVEVAHLVRLQLHQDHHHSQGNKQHHSSNKAVEWDLEAVVSWALWQLAWLSEPVARLLIKVFEP